MKPSGLICFAELVMILASGCVGAVAEVGAGTGGAGPGGCASGLTMCGTCVNTTNNPGHCGGCGQACPSGQVCDKGACSATCSAGTTSCGSSCANVSTDPTHCGDCATACRADQLCSAGSCGCPAGQSLCNGVCASSCGGTGGMGGTGGTMLSCSSPAPGRSPLHRLTSLSYNNTIRDLLLDDSKPANGFPPETQGSGFGNDADEQSVSLDLAHAYRDAAEAIAARATATPAKLKELAPCAETVTTANEESCARTVATNLLPRAYRRVVMAAEVEPYLAVYRKVRALSPTVTFASGVAAMVEVILQSPEFIYRVEFGTTDPANPGLKKLTGREMANRLSYYFWQSMPDQTLTMAADANALATPAGVMTQATRLLDSPKAKAMVAHFFDHILPVTNLTDLARDMFPKFSPAIGQAMRQETHRALEYEIFENTTQAPGSPYVAGSWPAVLTAPYTFVNEALFNYYGASAFSGTASVTGTTLQKVNLNTTQRLGLLTQGGVMTGLTTTNLTNPVMRGGFIMNKLLCKNISFPTDPELAAKAMQPVAYTGWTARERYDKHREDPVCFSCHQFMDPVGFALENFDAVGMYRTKEHAVIGGETRDTSIDPRGSVPGVGEWATPIELVQTLAASESLQACFASRWMEFGYGRQLDSGDACNRQYLLNAFKSSGYNIKKMLLEMTQTDAFLYRSAQ